MKQKLLFLGILIASFSMNAQYTVEDHLGNQMLDGGMVVFNEITYPEASWDFFVNNTSTTETIRMKIEFVSAVNADGTQMELCFGLCYTGITLGWSYPPNAEYVEILPGDQTLAGNHMYNADPGNGTDVLEYVFRFYQIDATGTEIGEDLTMTYRYDPLLGVDDVDALNINVYATSISNELVVEVDEAMQLSVYNLQGRVVKRQNIEAGTSQVNMSDLSSQMYLVHFENNRGVSHTTKVIVN
jgi:hypothetical protein